MGTAHVTYTRTLMLFAKHSQSTQVCCQIETVTEGVPGIARQVSSADEYLDDATLTAHAAARGAATWDEDDICALLTCERAITLPAPEP